MNIKRVYEFYREEGLSLWYKRGKTTDEPLHSLQTTSRTNARICVSSRQGELIAKQLGGH